MEVGEMPERLLQLDDLRSLTGPDRVASLFGRLGYNAEAQPLNLEDLQLTFRSAEAVYDAHLIADQGDGGLQVLLFQLQPEEWSSPSVASGRMKAIASQVGRRDTEFLLLATKDYNQLMLVNPRKSFDDKMNLKASIRKLLIDRTNPTAYDLDRLEAIAVRGKSPQELYKAQCEAFDVEKLTKAFYRGYKQLFDKVQQGVKRHNNHPYFDDPDHLHQFSQRLLGRLMFLYFLQKKEFLAGDRRFLTTQYQRLRLDPDDMDYYTTVLEPLFFETLNQSRPNLESKWGKIPYLNGGLFDRDYGTGIKDAAGRLTPEIVTLPNGLFDPGDTDSILGFFNSYNFTISENTSGDEDVAVDPEMLGKVFENMLAAEERGQSGTFYTPRGIVQFMCSEVLSRYLSDEAGMELEVVQKLIDYEPDLPDSDFNQLMSPQQARELKKAIASLKVLDPAVGSGAFPLGMMQVILNVRQAVARREGMKVSRGSLTISQWKRDIIANNLYGVDIKPEAIEIAKLRMWLSLVVDIPNIEDVEPLPNLDYKLMCGDSLISTIHGEQLIPDPTKIQQGMLAVTPIQIAIAPLLELEKRYFDAQTEERHRLREQILEAEANVFRVAVSDRHQYWLGKQKELETKIKTMKAKVSKAQEKEKAEIATKLAELDKFAKEVESGERSLNFFQYHLHFRDVFESKGGFDVVVGNPPYVFARNSQDKGFTDEDKKYFYDNFELAEYQVNLYPLFIEKGCSLLNNKGHFAYITPNNWMTINTNKKLRHFILNKSNIKVVNFLAQVFESASVDSSIIILENHTSNSTISLLEYTKERSLILIKELNSKYFVNQKDYLINIESFKEKESIQLLEKIDSKSIQLKFVADVKAGLKAYEVNAGIPLQTKEIKENRAYHAKSQLTDEYFKYLDGESVGRYYLNWHGEYLKWGKNLSRRRTFNLQGNRTSFCIKCNRQR
ncbi:MULTISPECIES: N-6 DNA methylase [unclassified Microcystis]|uniref:Eco57I restriction-modification methylase domain-containing protein n=2 Tax=unclassified Microcystis TaxID=2643300 RepID=UPI00258DBB06|nr:MULTISPECIES: N-6 DNA methylase [unclassified Microcystis]